MADSPYTPPKARVADSEPALGERPRQVRIALQLIYASIAIGLVTAAFDPEVTTSDDPMVMLVALAAGLGITLAFAILMGRGQNWARILFAVLTVLGIALMFYFWEEQTSLVSSVSSLLQSAMQLAAVGLTFTRSANNWYRRT